MKLFRKKKNKGYVLVIVLMIGATLLTTGYYLYDLLILSNKITSEQIYKNQLTLYQISVADTVQAILDAVVNVENESDNSSKERLFHLDRTKKRFDVSEQKYFPQYIRKVYTSGYDKKVNSLKFEFKTCNFINTKIYDTYFSQDRDVGFSEPSCANNDVLKADVVVKIVGTSLVATVNSSLESKGITSSSSFVLPLLTPATNCEDYVEVDEETDRLVLKNVVVNASNSLELRPTLQTDYVTLPGLYIDGDIPYGILISRYGGANFVSDPVVIDALGNKVYKARFSVYTHYRSFAKERFTTYKHGGYIAIPNGQDLFWSDPREYYGCNSVYPITGSGVRYCNKDERDEDKYNGVVDVIGLGNGGWSDDNQFNIEYTIYKDKNGKRRHNCSNTKFTISGLTPGLRQTGCFDENTLVEDNLGKKIKIKNLTMGQSLKNPVTGDDVYVVKTVAGPEGKDLIEIVTTDGNSILVTQDHPLKTSRGLISADKLMNKDLLFNEKGSVRISKIKKIPSNNRTVYNFMVGSDKDVSSDEDHYIIANGIISGDLYLQTKLKYKSSLAKK